MKYPFSPKVIRKLKGSPSFASNYAEVFDYISRKSFIRNIVIVNIAKLDEERIRSLRNYKDYKIVIVYNNVEFTDDNYYLNIIDMFFKNDITDIEFVKKDQIDNYLSNFNIGTIKDTRNRE